MRRTDEIEILGDLIEIKCGARRANRKQDEQINMNISTGQMDKNKDIRNAEK
jgi:hypothetical protein